MQNKPPLVPAPSSQNDGGVECIMSHAPVKIQAIINETLHRLIRKYRQEKYIVSQLHKRIEDQLIVEVFRGVNNTQVLDQVWIKLTTENEK